MTFVIFFGKNIEKNGNLLYAFKYLSKMFESIHLNDLEYYFMSYMESGTLKSNKRRI